MLALPATQVASKECVTITGTVPGDRSQGAGVRGQGTEVRSQGTGDRGQGAGVRGQGTEVRGQRSEVSMSGDHPRISLKFCCFL